MASASARLPSARLLDDESQVLAENEGPDDVDADDHQDDDDDDDDDDYDALASHLIQDPAVEAEFCLALEMVRHRPLRVLAVEQDRGPGTGEDSGTSVHWQHSRFMRMYLDPQAHRTVDYFRRKFCLDTPLAPGGKHARNIVLISLEPSQALNTPSKSVGAFAASGATSVSSSAQELAIFAVPSQMNSLTNLAPTDGQHGTSPPPALLELVLGRKLVSKTRTRNSNQHPGTSSSTAPQSQTFDRLPPRPDDPLPRSSVTQLQARSGWPAKAPPGRGAKTLPPSSSRSLAKASSAPSLEYRDPGVGAARHPSLRGGITPGRRGEKRPQRLDLPTSPSGAKRARVEKRRADVIEMPLRGQLTDSFDTSAPERRAGPGPADDLPPLDDDFGPVLTKTLVSPLAPRGGGVLTGRSSARLAQDRGRDHDRDRDSTSAPALDEAQSQVAVTEPQASGAPFDVAAANKNTVRKLVHHQLLGRGLDRQDDDYAACFSPACAAVLTALRFSLSQRPLDRRLAAATAERILSIILPGHIDSDAVMLHRPV